jgi:hypothetical protein
MKKIHNIHDLHVEQKFLEHRRHQLEKELQHDWNDVKYLITDAGNSFFGDVKKNYVSKALSKGLSIGAGVLATKFGGKIGNKIFSWLK